MALFIDLIANQHVVDSLGWGFVLWLTGYILGFVLFFVVPPALIGWVITPIGIIITLWVLLRRISGDSLPYYLGLGIAWTAIAVVLVKLLASADGYHKPDVWLYYALTLGLPPLAYWWKSRRPKAD